MRARLIDREGGRRRFVLVLDAGEEAVEAILAFAAAEDVEGAGLTGIGAFAAAVLGHFDPSTETFTRNDVGAQTEVAAMTGNLARGEDGAPKLHCHVVLGCVDGTARAGHLVEGHVRPTLEVIVEEAPTHMHRGHDARTGLVLLEPRGLS